MPKQNNFDDDYESDDFEETETLVSRSKSAGKLRLGSKKASKKSIRRPGSPSKSRPTSSLSMKTGHELWVSALKKRQASLGTGGTGFSASPRHKTPIDYWVDTLRKTGTGISTESSGRNTFTGLKKNNDLNMAYHSTSHHLRQIMGFEKKKNPEQTSRVNAGTPAYKTPEEYYDEVLDLRKQISNLSHENSTMKAKVRRLEEDKIKKGKEMEGLLNPSKSEELRRTLGDRKADSGAVIHSLKQKILKLEMQLRDKDASHAKLLGDLKVTKIEEMKCQMEVLFQEISRLQQSKDTGVSKSARSVGGKEATMKVKALNETILRLTKNNELLQAENRKLKEELDEDDRDGEDSPRGYDNMNKRQLLSTLKKMEAKVGKLERKLDADNLSILSLEKSRSAVPGKIDLTGSIENRLHQLDERETELLDELAKQKDLIQKLKEERLYYKEQCGAGTPRTPRRPSTRGSDHSRPPTGRRRSGVDEDERLREEKIENLKKRSAANNIQKNWRNYKKQKETEEEKRLNYRVNEFRENRAARKIQNEWSGYKHRRHDEELEDATYMIQGALKGHQARRQRLSGYQTDDSTGSDSLDSATALIQSSIRGHMGRQQRMRALNQSWHDSTDDEDYRRPSSAIRSRHSSGGRRDSRSPRTSLRSRNIYDEDDDDF